MGNCCLNPERKEPQFSAETNSKVEIEKEKTWLDQIDLESLMKERTKERRQSARDRLQHDMEVIANRKMYKEDLEPFPEGAFEKLYGNQIWEKVLDYVTDLSDLTSLYYTCTLFREILEDKRKSILASKTLKIILGKERSKKAKPVLLLDFLHIREVSKSWKAIADRELFGHDFARDSWYNEIQLDHPIYPVPLKTNMIELDVDTIDRALELLPRGLLQPIQKSSFIRKLTVKRPPFIRGLDHANMRSFCEKVLAFLEFYGESIWHFSFNGGYRVEAPLYDYEYVRRMLLKMPNVKSIDIYCLTDVSFGREYDVLPFPELENLQIFTFPQSWHEGELLLEQVYRSCINLKVFWDRPASDRDQGLRNYSRERVMALQALDVERCMIRFMNLEFLRDSTWPLKVLDITHLSVVPINCSELWPALNRFGETLENLKIYSYGRVLKDDPNVTLQLPRLKVLNLETEIRKGTIGLDDLLHLKSLQEIVIGSYEEESRPDDKNGLVKVFGIQKKMEESNIWRCFPDLKRLVLRYELSLWVLIGYIRCGSCLIPFGDWMLGQGVRQIGVRQ